MGSISSKGLVEGTIAGVLAFLLTFIPTTLGDYTIALAIIPIVFISLRRGMLQGLLTGILAGLLVFLIQDGSEDTVANIVVQFAPFAFIGISGIYAKFTQRTLNNKRFPNAALNIATASLFGALLYYLWHFIGHVTFNADIVPEGQSVFSYFMKIDGLSLLMTFGVTAVLLLLVAKLSPKLFVPKNTPFLSRKEKSRILND